MPSIDDVVTCAAKAHGGDDEDDKPVFKSAWVHNWMTDDDHLKTVIQEKELQEIRDFGCQ